MSSSDTLGFNTEIYATFTKGAHVLEIRKTDVDTWLFIAWEDQRGEQINKEAITLFGEQLRAMCKHSYLFTHK